MSKRTRGSRRPQQRRAPSRPATRAARGTAPRATAAAAVERAPSELEAAPELAEELVDDDAPAAREQVARIAATPAAPRSRARPSGVLAAKAASEYVYVVQDVRRIVLVAAGLFGTMFLLWILIVVLRVIPV